MIRIEDIANCLTNDPNIIFEEALPFGSSSPMDVRRELERERSDMMDERNAQEEQEELNGGIDQIAKSLDAVEDGVDSHTNMMQGGVKEMQGLDDDLRALDVMLSKIRRTGL